MENYRNNKGRFIKGHKEPEEIKQKRSLAMGKAHKSKKFGFDKGLTPWNKGKHMSDEVKKILSEKTKEQFRTKGHPFKGKKHTEESKQKMSKNLIGKSKGADRWNWKGGVTPVNRLMRSYKSRWKNWRESVFKRDNYICQNPNCKFCNNKRGVELHPHHIKPLYKFPELAYEVNNGITYCVGFHLKSGLHKLQFKEYGL